MVSVCMTTYNGERFLKNQLDSILCQLSDNDELIIGDDASTDQTVNIIKSYNDHRIKLIENSYTIGVNANMENIILKSKGQVILLSDQDDVWHTKKVEVYKKELEKYDFISSDSSIIDQNNNEIIPSFFTLVHARPGLMHNLYKNCYMGHSLGFKRHMIKSFLPIPSNVPMYDWWFGLVAEKAGTIKLIEKKLQQYRRHNNNQSTTSRSSSRTLAGKIMSRIRLAYLLLKIN